MKRLTPFALIAACATPGPAGAIDADLRGQEELTAGHPAKAYDHFQTAVKDDPQSLAAFRHLVEAARAVGRLDGLTALAQKALTERPSDPLAHYRLGLCLFAHTEGEAAGIAELAQAATLETTGPDAAELQLRYGSALLEAERPAEALTALEAAVRLRPDDPHIHLPLTLALHRSGRDSDALKEIATVLPLLPPKADVETYRHLMDRITSVARSVPPSAKPRFEEALAVLGQSDTPAVAIDLLEGLLGDQPLLAPAHAALGLAYLRSGDNSLAVFHLRRAIELDPSAAEPYLYLGQIFHELRRDTEAQQQLELAVARNPLLDAAHDQLAQLALQRGDAPAAAREARVLAGIRVGDPTARMQLAQALKLAGDLPGAEAQLQVLAAPPAEHTRKSSHGRGSKDELSTDGSDQQTLIDEATRLEAQLELGGVELEEGLKARDPIERGRKFTDARRWLDKVLESQPDNVAAQRLAEAVPK